MARKRNKSIQKKIDVKLSLFADNTFLYIENPKESTKKLVELTNELSKLAGYEIKIQKSIVFLYTSKNNPKMKLKNNSINKNFKNNKILKNKFNKEFQNLHSENYKILLKEILKGLNKWKNAPRSWMG